MRDTFSNPGPLDADAPCSFNYHFHVFITLNSARLNVSIPFLTPPVFTIYRTMQEEARKKEESAKEQVKGNMSRKLPGIKYSSVSGIPNQLQVAPTP